MRIPTLYIPGLSRRDCPVCGSEFLLHRADQTYCSTRCRVKANRRKYPGGRPPEITRLGPATATSSPIAQSTSSSPDLEQPLESKINFTTEPSTAEEDILALWRKKD